MSEYQKECIIPHLLGDGYLSKTVGTKTNAVLRSPQKERIFFLFLTLFNHLTLLILNPIQNTLKHVQLTYLV